MITQLSSILAFSESRDKFQLEKKKQNEDSLIDCINKFEKESNFLTEKNCKENAERFSNTKFRENLNRIVEEFMEELRNNGKN